ncbi:YHS domain-containing protein [Microbispora siamensis]
MLFVELLVPKGMFGEWERRALAGRVRRSSDFLALIEEARTGPAAHVPDGMVVDPVCGATVPLEEAVVLERDGQTYGFCCTHCRGHFVRESGAAGASLRRLAADAPEAAPPAGPG